MIDESFDSNQADEPDEPTTTESRRNDDIIFTDDDMDVSSDSALFDTDNDNVAEPGHRPRNTEAQSKANDDDEFPEGAKSPVSRYENKVAIDDEKDQLKARIKELEGQLSHHRSEAWKRETEICNAFRKCAEELDAANNTISELKAELAKKAKETATSNDSEALKKKLSECRSECESLRMQLKGEHEQVEDLVQKVTDSHEQL